MAYWLVKSEPDVYSLSDLERDKTTDWDGVRNYQARNYLKAMAVKDSVLYYHSSTEPAGIVGLAVVSKIAGPDLLQFDSKSEYYDPKATKAEPRWFAPQLKFVKRFEKLLTLADLKKEAALKDMVLLQRGSRLSVQPVTEKQFVKIIGLAR